MNKSFRCISMSLVTLVAGAVMAHAQVAPVPTDLNLAPACLGTCQPDTGGVPGSNLIQVQWDPMPGATAYAIYRSTATGAETLLTTVASNGQQGIQSQTYNDTGLVNGPPNGSGPVYFYKVASINASGTSVECAEDATVQPEPTSSQVSNGTGTGTIAGTPV